MSEAKRSRQETEGALRLLADVFQDERDAKGPVVPRGESLGDALARLQQQHGWTSKRMAMALGVPHADLQRWKADLDVPDEAAMFRICDALGTTPVQVLPMVEQSARDALHRLVDEAAGTTHAIAARQRGPITHEGDRILGMRVPLPLRRVIAGELNVEADDCEPIGREVRRLATLDDRTRELHVGGLVAMMRLEGEDSPSFEEFLEAQTSDEDVL